MDPDEVIKYNRRRQLMRNALYQKELKEGQMVFDKWLAKHRASKYSQQDDLPSSEIPDKSDIISVTHPQIFAVIDTCSIVSHRQDFIEHVNSLKKIFAQEPCPIKIIISLPVLEELDKCNRPSKKRKQPDQMEQLMQIATILQRDPNDVKLKASSPSARININQCFNNNSGPQPSTSTSNPIVNVQQPSTKPLDPPRHFMRFLEEEMRTSEVLISELDPFKQTSLNQGERMFEVVNKDDRILDCCIRTKAYLNKVRRHYDTKVVLISEDNVFKAKSTTHNVASYRWAEFKSKFRNFGHKHYAYTPLFPNGIPQRKPKKKIHDPRWMAVPMSFPGPPPGTEIIFNDRLSEMSEEEKLAMLRNDLCKGREDFYLSAYPGITYTLCHVKSTSKTTSNVDQNNNEMEDVQFVEEVINMT